MDQKDVKQKKTQSESKETQLQKKLRKYWKNHPIQKMVVQSLLAISVKVVVATAATLIVSAINKEEF